MPYYLELLLTVGNLVLERHREMVFDLGRDLLGDLNSAIWEIPIRKGIQVLRAGNLAE
jgi:hypothetical protein